MADEKKAVDNQAQQNIQETAKEADIEKAKDADAEKVKEADIEKTKDADTEKVKEADTEKAKETDAEKAKDADAEKKMSAAEKEAEAEALEAKFDKEAAAEEADAGDLILENQRESVPLTPENAKFTRSAGGLISLELNVEGKQEKFERVVVVRAFPITNPEEFLSVREPNTRQMGRGKEIGMIRYMDDFDKETQAIINEELERRYFSPQITKIISMKEKFGYYYWDAETSAGMVTFILNNPFSNIRVLEDGRIIITDIDGNCFEISDPQQLDPASYKRIEVYL